MLPRSTLISVAASVAALLTIWGGLSAALPLLRSDPPPFASKETANSIDMKVAQLSNQTGQIITKQQRAIDFLVQHDAYLMRQNLENDYKYWSSQRDLALTRLKKNPRDPLAQSMLSVATTNMTRAGTQLGSK